MPGIPNPMLVPKQVYLVHDLGLGKQKSPMYPVQYLRKNTTTRVSSPRLTAKFVVTPAQDLVKKKKKSNKNKIVEYILRVDPHIMIRSRQIHILS